MTEPPRDTHAPPVPVALRPAWDELTDLAPRMTAAHDEYERLRLRCRQLVTDLLRGGVKRRDLVDKPFSPALLSRIRQKEGLPKERRGRES